MPAGADDGGEGNRTPDLLNAIQALSQLSYTPGKFLPTDVSDRNLEGYSGVVCMSTNSVWNFPVRPVFCSALAKNGNRWMPDD